MAVTLKNKTKVAVKANTSVKSTKTGAHVQKESVIGMVEVPAAYANVGVQVAHTRNLGDFNSVKVGISIHHPCAPTPDAIEVAYEFCMNWTNDKFESILEDIAKENEQSGDDS